MLNRDIIEEDEIYWTRTDFLRQKDRSTNNNNHRATYTCFSWIDELLKKNRLVHWLRSRQRK